MRPSRSLTRNTKLNWTTMTHGRVMTVCLCFWDDYVSWQRVGSWVGDSDEGGVWALAGWVGVPWVGPLGFFFYRRGDGGV